MRNTTDMAREAGAVAGSPAPNAPEIIFTQCLDIERFAALVRADEREALIEITQALLRDDPFDATASAIQLAIRNRGNT